MSKRKTFTNVFKEMIVELSLSWKPVKENCSEYSLSETAVRNWIKKKKPMNIKRESFTLEELNRIRKENAKLKEKVEILKKAMAIFAKK
ncbi:transposase [Thermoanaerobacterium sp. RBIITD]|uniref:transposase n=1 Tax=Thermoanaerobacterium sp. RBIITD TaxID=1550240 RepID=UPI000BC006A8|nr:transposase [Thermoanaerobacterium sp. RBIITD]SNX53672.1 transposase [Thermoanaerobacterium sp. RBIITD]